MNAAAEIHPPVVSSRSDDLPCLSRVAARLDSMLSLVAALMQKPRNPCTGRQMTDSVLALLRQ